MKQAYDKKNHEDFEKNTQQINAAIAKIASDINLKPTISEISRLTGIHRNTISNRSWPAGRLKKIKSDRTLSTMYKKESKLPQKKTEDVLNEKLDNTMMETVYWFNLCQNKEDEIKQLNTRLKTRNDSFEFWKNEAMKARKECDDLKNEVERLTDLLRTIKE